MDASALQLVGTGGKSAAGIGFEGAELAGCFERSLFVVLAWMSRGDGTEAEDG
jgi:hypothetical protein